MAGLLARAAAVRSASRSRSWSAPRRGASPIRSPAPAWGLVIWWPFLIFSTLFVVWRQRGFFAGVGVAAATHALQNLGPALLLATSN